MTEVERCDRNQSYPRGGTMRTILTTVGTSLLSNARRDLGIDDPNDQQLSNYLHHNLAAKTSAETNSLARILVEGDHITFLHSQTEEGKQCAELLEAYYQIKGYDTKVVNIPDLAYSETRFKMRGLRSLVATLIGEIRNEKS